ncbi:MAG: WhiB family transcriptional regulator [Candidatus Sericytochromatia bacterium]
MCSDPAARLLFDAAPVDAEAEEEALWACSNCPALQACREWVLGLSEWRRPAGVVGGLVIGSSGRVRRYRRRVRG